MTPPAMLPWEEAMAAALGVLRWSPCELWSATPRELAAALSALVPLAPGPPGPADLARLMRAFPDVTGDQA